MWLHVEVPSQISSTYRLNLRVLKTIMKAPKIFGRQEEDQD